MIPVSHSWLKGLVDVAGIEPATPCLQNRGLVRQEELSGFDRLRIAYSAPNTRCSAARM